VPVPRFAACPPGATLLCSPDASFAPHVASLLANTYWNVGADSEAIIAAHRASTAWVAAIDADGCVIASARALSDHATRAWIHDVIVADRWRGRGLGSAVLRTLLDHPTVRGVRRVHLKTRDAHELYARFGFRDRASLPALPYASSEMVLARS
jgi:predicted GNAT family acetyltransferase